MSACRKAAVILSAVFFLLSDRSFAQSDRLETIRARQEFWLKKRLDREGKFSMDGILQAKAELDAKRAAASLQKNTTATGWGWEWMGPGNIGGRIKDILINPYDHTKMWIASPGGGIWKTTNTGLSWEAVDDFLPSLNVVSLAMDPILTQNMYAGTGEYDYMGGGGYPITAGRMITGVGIYKSTDGGNIWFLLPSTANNPEFFFVSRLEHYRASSGWLLAATYKGLYRTTNGGDSWTKILAPTFGEPVRDVRIDPANYSRILVGTTSDLYLSTDAGSTWNRRTFGARGGLPASPGTCKVAIAPTNTNVMYVSMALNSGGNQLWRSADGGLNWLQKPMPSTAIPRTNAIWVSPVDPNFLLVGGTDYIARSTDGGSTYIDITDWRGYHNGRNTPGFSPHGDFHVITNDPNFDGSTNKRVYVGDDGGIQRTTDISVVSKYTGWSNLAYNLGITQFYGGAASPDGHLLVGGTQDLYNVNYYATRPSWGPYWGVQGWWNPTTGDGGYAAIDPTDGRYIYVEAQFLGVDRSVDSGKTYIEARVGLTDVGNDATTLFIAPLVMDPNHPTVLAAGGIHIWRTTDRAATWYSIRDPLPGNPRCSAIEIAKPNSNTIWVGYENGLISYTTNLGSSWHDVGYPGGIRFVTDLAINPTPTAYAEVMVTLGGYATDNVWLSSDNGQTWVNRVGTPPDNLPAIQINTVRYHPLQTDRVYVGTDLGVFASTDKGLHWSVAPQSLKNEGPANTPVEELFWQGQTYLIAATHGRGMFRVNPLVDDVAESPPLPQEFGLEQNYPNPFNPKTSVRFRVPGVSDVRVAVYDLLGREVAVLVQEKKSPGRYEVQFDASGLPSGVYFYRMRAGSFVETRKSLLIR